VGYRFVFLKTMASVKNEASLPGALAALDLECIHQAIFI